MPRAGSAGGQALKSVARALATGGGLCLDELDCGGLCITDGGVRDLALALRRRREIVAHNPGVEHAALRRLVLTGGCVGPSGLGALLGEVADAKGGLAALQHLDLSGAQLNGGRTSLALLHHFLRDGGGPALKTLGLARCGLGTQGMAGVAVALAEGGRCMRLEELYLGANGLTMPDAVTVVRTLVVERVCPALRLLSLDSNLLGPEGVREVLQNLGSCPVVKQQQGQPVLWLSLRGMGFSGAASMMAATAKQEGQECGVPAAAAAFAEYRRLLAAISAKHIRVDVRAAAE